MMFTKIEDSEVLIKTAGTFKVLPVYIRNSNGCLYAKNGQSYIALLHNSLTSSSKITWQELNIDYEFEKGNMKQCKKPIF